jgi:SP family sugar:H+ symporter-like MFS transporter
VTGDVLPARGPSEVRAGRVLLVSMVAALGGFLFGFDTAVINGAVGAIDDQFDASSVAIGFTVSSALLGSAVGAWFAGGLADRHGRVRLMRVAAFLFFVSAVLSGLAGSLLVLIVARVIGGFGVGLASVLVPTYIAEIAPADRRGRLGSMQQLAITVGIFVALFERLCNSGDRRRRRRGLRARRGGLALDALGGGDPGRGLRLWHLSDSALTAFPRREGVRRGGRARAALARRGRPRRARRGHQPDRANRARGLAADLTGPRFGLLPIVWIGLGVAVLQQFVGINVIFYYSSVLWSSVGFSDSDALLITVITSVINIGTTFVAIASVDRFGRKPLLLIGAAGMAVTLAALAVIFGTAPNAPNGDPDLGSLAGVAALVSANLFVVFFGMSWGPIVWVLLGEMFPNRIRAIALSVAAAAQWVANFAVSTTFPPLKDAGLGLAYGLYAGAAVLAVLFVLKAVPETRGKTLEEM